MRKKEGGNEDVLAGLGYEENGSRRWKDKYIKDKFRSMAQNQ